MHLTKADLEKLCEMFKAKALEEHALLRKWQARALDAEARLSALEAGDAHE